MQFLSRLLSRMMQSIFGSRYERRADSDAAQKEAGAYEGEYSNQARDFEGDYNAAIKLLKDRLDKKYPSGHYGRLRSGTNSPYDHGEDRAQAVDTMSVAIAMALRKGATLRQAVEAGAASIGI